MRRRRPARQAEGGMNRLPYRPIPDRKTTRHTQLGPADVRLLDDWGEAIHSAFPEAIGVYLVGSSMVRKDWRDIDVRIVLRDADFTALSGVIRPRRLNLMLTLWGRQVTGLPIDCQVQAMSWANERYPTPKHPRNPLGGRTSEGVEGA